MHRAMIYARRYVGLRRVASVGDLDANITYNIEDDATGNGSNHADFFMAAAYCRRAFRL